VKDWIEAQDVVFSNCPGGQNTPKPTTGTLAADRDYQIAAACFYSERFAEARTRFQAIAGNSRSPWRTIAPYVAARALIRKATFPKDTDTNLLLEADQELQAIQRNPSLRPIHEAARSLAHFTAARVRQPELLRELSAALADPKQDAHFAANLSDFLFTMDRLGETDEEIGELATWIRAMQGKSSEMTRVAVKHWEETHSLPWLVAAMANVDPKDSHAAALVEAARKVPDGSPAYPTVTALRLPLEAGALGTAGMRAELDRLLPVARKEWPVSSVNQLLSLRMNLAESLDEMLRFAPRRAAGVFTLGESDTDDAKEDREFFDLDAYSILDRGLPLEMLPSAARSQFLPVHLRKRVTAVTFTRALALDHPQVATMLLPDMRRYFPKLGTLLDGYTKAAKGEAQRFAGTYLLLKNPGLDMTMPYTNDRRIDADLEEIDDYRGNWWDSSGPNLVMAQPAFLKAAEKEQFERYWAERSKLPAGPTALGQIAIAWATAHREDPRSPEALQLTVRATRYGLGDKKNGEISKAAFQLLHQRWPASEWARKTPYWFQ